MRFMMASFCILSHILTGKGVCAGWRDYQIWVRKEEKYGPL
jgi:hypothetical protein